jgi:hypothetical protein
MISVLLEHAWGSSPAQDRLWAQVTGLAPGEAVWRLLMALQFQAFIDDSSTPGGEFVLAGYIAPAQAWAQFAKEWEQLLPSGTIAENGKYHFKMSEMAMTPERMERVPAFYWIIEKYVTASVSARMNLADFKSALERAREFFWRLKLDVNFARFENPYYFLFRILMDRFHDFREKMVARIPLDEQVDFIFDSQTEKSFILSAWDEIVAVRPEEAQKYYGATPRFEDDQKFLPLQAADLWAWWVREWYEEDSSDRPEKMRILDFGKWRGKKERLNIAISTTEDKIFEQMKAITAQNFHRAVRRD